MSDEEKGSTPEVQELWRQLAEKIGGEYEEGAWYNQHIIHAPHKNWTITLDTYVSTTRHENDEGERIVFTRIRAPFVTKNRLRLRVYEEGFWSKLGKLLGMQDIEIGDETFDDRFIVKSNRESLVKDFFTNERIKELLIENPSVYLEVGDAEGRFKKDAEGAVYEVYHREHGVIDDINYLEALYELFSCCLDQLYSMESAWDEGPMPMSISNQASLFVED